MHMHGAIVRGTLPPASCPLCCPLLAPHQQHCQKLTHQLLQLYRRVYEASIGRLDTWYVLFDCLDPVLSRS